MKLLLIIFPAILFSYEAMRCEYVEMVGTPDFDLQSNSTTATAKQVCYINGKKIVIQKTAKLKGTGNIVRAAKELVGTEVAKLSKQQQEIIEGLKKMVNQKPNIAAISEGETGNTESCEKHNENLEITSSENKKSKVTQNKEIVTVQVSNSKKE